MIHFCLTLLTRKSIQPSQSDFSQDRTQINLSSKAVSPPPPDIHYIQAEICISPGLVGASYILLCSLNSLDIFNRGMGSPQSKKKRKEKKKRMNCLLHDHAGDQTQNPSNSSRVPFHWASQSISCLLTGLKLLISYVSVLMCETSVIQKGVRRSRAAQKEKKQKIFIRKKIGFRVNIYSLMTMLGIEPKIFQFVVECLTIDWATRPFCLMVLVFKNRF